MQDNKYCYPNSDVLINKLNIKDAKSLFEAEKKFTAIRLHELQENPIKGNFDFNHLKKIHKYIFQDLYDWAGKVRTVEIGKGNLFCTTACIQSYADSVFRNYFSECYSAKNNFTHFINLFSKNYGDLNALHPFREGNGRTQREFARLICNECGYDFNLSCTTHEKMLEASKLSFNVGDNRLLAQIFSDAVTIHENGIYNDIQELKILTSDDLAIGNEETYDSYNYQEYEHSDVYDKIYKEKITELKNGNFQNVKEKSLDDILFEAKQIADFEYTDNYTDGPDLER